MANLTTEQACLTLPPVQIQYDPKGRMVDSGLGGLETYEIKNGSKKAVLFVYDIYGYSAQIKQGADLLSAAGYDVYVPDFFKGGHLDKAAFPHMQKHEQQATRAKFDAGAGKKETQVDALGGVLKELKGQYDKVAVAGFCWGAICTLVPGYDAYMILHPGGYLSPDKLEVPTCLLPSMNENEEKMNAFHDAMLAKPCGSKCVLKWYKSMIHGWAAARGDLDNPEVRKGFQDAYETMATFMGNVL